ncbi:MAG: AI-2E family transporter [Caulobacterales bacterium]
MTDHPAPSSAETARHAQVVMAVIAAGAAMAWLAPILTPMALAMFLMVLIDGLARALRSRLPTLHGGAALVIAVVICCVVFGLVVFIVADNAALFVERLMGYGPRIDGLLSRLERATQVGLPRSLKALVAQLNPALVLPTIAGTLQDLAGNAVFILIYLGFLLASRHGLERKAVRLFHDREERHAAVQLFLRVRNALERYLWIQTVCGAIIAAGSWAMMAAVGLDSAFFWAFIIFVVGYVPIIGAAVGILAPVLFALVQFDTLWQAVFLLIGLQALTMVVGNILLPRMQGRGLNIDPVVVLLSLAFWGAIWGVAGMFLSTPLTMLVMVTCAQFGGARWIAVLLSADGDPDSLGGESQAATAALATASGVSRKSDMASLSG